MDKVTIATLARLLGAFYYYSPRSTAVEPLKKILLTIDQLVPWQDQDLIRVQCQQLQNEIENPELIYQHSVLFEGQGDMEAPPWGSVYLDKEALLMGESEERYRAFLQQNNIILNTGMNEPEDQFGLMLMAFALLLEKDKTEQAQQLINEHLMTWALVYLTKLSQNKISLFYQALALITIEYLHKVKDSFMLKRI